MFQKNAVVVVRWKFVEIESIQLWKVSVPVAEARRPLAPRIPVETPAAPAVEAAPAAPVAEAPAEAAAETTFDPSKVRYGRRNVIKKAPELSEEA